MDRPHSELQIDINNYPSTGTVLVKVRKRLMDNATLDYMTIADRW
jgi:hypothetical protein